MKKILLMLLLSTAVFGASAQSTTASTASIDAAKAAGTGIAAQMRSASPVIVNGEMQTSGGVAVQQRANSGSMASKMEYFKSVTGVDGAVETGSGRGDTLGARGTTTTFLDFSCKTESSARKAAGGFVFQLAGCSVSGTSVASVTLQMCSALQKGGSCAEPAAFSAAATIPANTYANIDEAKLALGCNDTNAACRLTVTTSYEMTTSVSNFDKTVQDKAAAGGSDTNTAQGTLTTMRAKTNADGTNAYDTAMAGQGADMVACAQKNTERTNAGLPALTCDGSKQVNVGQTATNNNTCSQAPVCVRKATRTTSFTRSCTRTFPLTAKVCHFETKTKSCDITWAPVLDAKGLPTGTFAEQSNCTTDDVAGGSKFGAQDTAACGASHLVGTNTVCDHYNRTDFYSWAPAQVGQCKGDPYTVGSGCSKVAPQSQCTSGQWFGRTKNPLECVVVDMKDPDSVPTEVGNNVVPGCGVCQSSQQGNTCYAATPLAWADSTSKGPVEVQDNCGTMDLTACSLSTTEQVAADDSGLVTSQKENYSCSTQAESCAEYAKDPSCTNTTVSTFGTDQLGFRAPSSDEALNSALANTAVLNAVSGAATDAKGDPKMPLLFSGSGAQCDKPTGSFGSNGYYMDCCALSLTRPGGKFGKLNSCSEENARLAAARRANYAHYLGDWCSKRLPWPLKTCIRRTQGYCVFPGILPRIIQEQGRAQLSTMAASGASAQIEKATLSFPYYGTTGTWSAPTVVNGASIVGWQWPAYCKDLGEAAKVLEADPTAKECANQLLNYFAVCEKASGCGALPDYPELGAELWSMSTSDPLKNVTTAVSRSAVVTGSCEPTTGACTYQVSAWPAGVGGHAVVSKQVAFPVYTSVAAAAGASAVAGELSNVGDFMFKPLSISVVGAAIPTQLPATVRLDFSADGGQTWKPLDIPSGNNTDYALPGTDATLSGACSLDTNLCQFKMTGTATVTAIPWGSPQNPNCIGFTAGQISVLDFSKMDFSEWLSSVAANIKTPSGSTLSTMATNQMTAFNQTFEGGGPTTVTVAAPQGAQMARVAPAEGFGPFSVTLKVGGYWPYTSGEPTKDTDAVTGVFVDWGDCTPAEPATFVSEVNGQPARGFLLRHTYTRPQDVPAACGGGEVNLTHTLSLKISTTKSGIQTATLAVKNAFDTMPGAYSTNTNNTLNSAQTSTAVIPNKNSTTKGP